MHHISELDHVLFYSILYPFPCFVRVACCALGSVFCIRACLHVFRLSYFHHMATDLGVAEVHSCWFKSILHCVCHLVHLVA